MNLKAGDFVVRASDRQVIYLIDEDEEGLALRRIAAWPVGGWTNLLRKNFPLIRISDVDTVDLTPADAEEIEVALGMLEAAEIRERASFLGGVA